MYALYYTTELLIRSQYAGLGGAYLYRVSRHCYLLFILPNLDLNIIVIIFNIRCQSKLTFILMVYLGVLYENIYPVNATYTFP